MQRSASVTSDLLDFTGIDKFDLEEEAEDLENFPSSDENDQAIEYIDKMIQNISIKIWIK